MGENKKANDQNNEFFDRMLSEHSDEHRIVGQSEISHMKRFKKILELGNFRGCSLLDVGCGIGGFLDFLLSKNIACEYYGVDINVNMISEAKERHPAIAKSFFLHDILEKPIGRSYDYIVSVGPLNLDFGAGINIEMTMRMIRAMYDMCHLGMAISMTSRLTARPHEGTFYYDSKIIYAQTIDFCQNVRLDHTYLPHDFTIFCYKQDLYS